MFRTIGYMFDIRQIGRGFLCLSAIVLALLLVMSYAIWSAYAETIIIEPAEDVSTQGVPTGCGAGGNFECVAAGVTAPDTPDTGERLDFSVGDFDFYKFDTIPSLDTVTEVTFYVYYTNVANNQGNINVNVEVGLYDGTDFEEDGVETAQLPQRTTGGWGSVTFSDLSLSATEWEDLNIGLGCPRASGGQPASCRVSAYYAEVTYDPIIDVTVSAVGEQVDVEASADDQYLGGAFRLVRNVGSGDITSITLTETGSVDAENDLSNVRLFYDLDTTAPYDCTSESYDGTQSQFGSAGSFSSANGTTTFTDTVTISTTATLCLYVVADIEESAPSGATIAVEISDPTSDVGFVGSFIEPDTTVSIDGVSTVLRSDLTQIGYHWRNDDGSESDATSATGGTANTSFDAAPREQTLRLRMAVSNEGNQSSDATAYRLEYAQRVTTCDAVSSWTTVNSSGALWNMSPTTNLTDGADTTNIAEAIGGIPDPNDIFLTPNAGVRDTTVTTDALTLAHDEFVELEYAVEATDDAGDGVTYCFRLTDEGSPLDTYSVYPQATTFSDLTVSALGTQVATVEIPSTDVYSGGTFRIADQTVGAHDIQSITIAATGTADVANELSNIRLFYDLDATAPYDCSSESYTGSEAQYGSTISGGFNTAGEATFTGSVSVDPEQTICLYLVYDVEEITDDGGTVTFRINNPAEDIVIDQGDIGPAALVEIDGETTFVQTDIAQRGYHWRNNDGSETGATSATFGEPNTVLDNLRIEAPIRLRLAVANSGGLDASAQSFRLEWARRVSTCAAVNTWTDVGAAGGDWDMSPSANLTDGENTTNIAVVSGGISDPQPTFITPNAGVRDTNSQTDPITLTAYSFVELEYSIEATDEAIEGGTYCFRVSDAGSSLESYDIYAQATIKEPTDYLVQRGFLDITGTSDTIEAGIDYEAPSSASNAFIRITNTLNTGAGAGTVGDADDVTVYISNASNITDSVTFTRPDTAGGTTRVAWEIVEYTGATGGQNEFIVRQHGAVNYDSASATVSSPTVSGVVDDDKVVVFITGQLNPDTSTNYQLGNSTADWDGGGSLATFTRGATGNTSGVSYSVVEFTGSNWQIQRSEHTYTNAGSTETETIDPVNSLSRAFLHTQKRMGAGLNTHADFGHQVWLSGIGQISFLLDSTANSPEDHTSVAWVIENTQIAGERMVVTRSSGTQSGGTNPTLLAVNIGKTLEDLEIASIFMNNSGDDPGTGGGQNAFPEPLMSARIISPTQYELYIAHTRGSRDWRAEVVEWPTAARTFTQNYFRFYANNDELTPDTVWPEEEGETVGENSPILLDNRPVGFGQSFRLRMSVEIDAAGKVPGIDAFKLQYGERVTSCEAIAEWHDVGGPSASSLWRGHPTSVTAATPVSGDPPTASDLLLSVSNVAGTYEEGGSSAFTPFAANPGDNVEFDWSIEHNGADEETEYCFRMIESNGLEFVEYDFYPRLLTAAYRPVLLQWQWFSDTESLTPTVPLADAGVTPIDLQNTQEYSLRVNLQETAGGVGENVKFALQYSEYSDFQDGGTIPASISGCVENSLWCYADGAGNDNQSIDETVLSLSDTCSSGTGVGCGTYHEAATTTSTFTQDPFTTTEHEFTLRQAGARANAVYYFRLYDVTNDRPVTASTSNPNANIEGAQLVFTVTGVAPETSVANITTNYETTADTVTFTSLPFNQPQFAAQALTVDTSATDGYQVLMYAGQQLTNSYGDIIPPVAGSNQTPSGWSTGCDLTVQTGCFGYHTTDATLAGGSTRFSAFDTYAAFSTTPAEVMFSPVPAVHTQHLIYQVEVGVDQIAGDYTTDINFLAVPRF